MGIDADYVQENVICGKHENVFKLIYIKYYSIIFTNTIEDDRQGTDQSINDPHF